MLMSELCNCAWSSYVCMYSVYAFYYDIMIAWSESEYLEKANLHNAEVEQLHRVRTCVT